MVILGIDVGGSGIKGAPVETDDGSLLEARYRIATPRPATPKAVARTIRKIARHFDWHGRIGCGLPAVVRQGVVKTAANIDPAWVGTKAAALFEKKTTCRTRVINDADAAGLAEMRFGAGRGHKGVVVVITVGTGLGTSVFSAGTLLPNTELGHVLMNGKEAEELASDAVRKREELSWSAWAARFNGYLQYLERLFWPDLFIIGGGTSKKHARFLHLLQVQAEVTPATLFNEAGSVGAALAAEMYL